MSLVIETYEKGKIYVELLWDKYAPHYHVKVLRVNDSRELCQCIKDLTYCDIDKARESFRRQRAKVKKGEIA